MRVTHAVIASAVIATTGTASAINTLDLTSFNSGEINGAWFETAFLRSTGTGVLDPFVRVQANGTAEGYNTDISPPVGQPMPDVKTGTWTHDFQLSHLPIVVNPAGIAAGSYYEVLLDINQTANDPLLSIDALLIYSRSTQLTTANTLAALTGSGATLQYDLDGSPDGDSEILLNYGLNTGSGSGDMIAYFPTSLFDDAAQTDWIYFYSHFGANAPIYDENDGFEEWGVRATTTTNVPDGGTTAMLLGLGLGALGMLRRKLSA